MDFNDQIWKDTRYELIPRCHFEPVVYGEACMTWERKSTCSKSLLKLRKASQSVIAVHIVSRQHVTFMNAILLNVSFINLAIYVHIDSSV